QAHAAVAGNRQAGMVAIMRNLDAGELGRLDEIQAGGSLDFLAVNGEFRHLISSRSLSRGGVLERTTAELDVRFEFVAKLGDIALDRHRDTVGEHADRIA